LHRCVKFHDTEYAVYGDAAVEDVKNVIGSVSTSSP